MTRFILQRPSFPFGCRRLLTGAVGLGRRVVQPLPLLWSRIGAADRLAGDMIKFFRSAVTYDTLRKECLETIRQWPGCETVAGIRLIRDNSPAGFSAKVTLYGRAEKKVG
jgi:hypothetical protein